MKNNALETALNLATQYPQLSVPNFSNTALDQLGIDSYNISLVEKITLEQFSLLFSSEQLEILNNLIDEVSGFYGENGVFNNAQMAFLNQHGFKKSAYLLRYRTDTFFNLIFTVGICNSNGENIDFLAIRIDMLKKLKKDQSDSDTNITYFLNNHLVKMVSLEAINNRLNKVLIKDCHVKNYDGLFFDTMPQHLFSEKRINLISFLNDVPFDNRLSSVLNDGPFDNRLSSAVSFFEQIVKTSVDKNELSLLACYLAYWNKDPNIFINSHFYNVFFKELESNVFNISHVVLNRVKSNSKRVVFELFLGITPKDVLQKWLSDYSFVDNSLFKKFEGWFNLPANISMSYEIEFVENDGILNLTIKANDLLSSQFINGINENHSVAKMLFSHTKFGKLSTIFSDCIGQRVGDDWENFKKLQTAYYEHMMYGIDLNGDNYESYAYADFDESILSVTKKLSKCPAIGWLPQGQYDVYPIVLRIDDFYVPYKFVSGMLLHSAKNDMLSCSDKFSWLGMDCSLSFVDLSKFIESNELGIVVEINNPSDDILAYAHMLKAVW